MLADIQLFKLVIILCNVYTISASVCDVNTIYNSKGDLKIALVLNECYNNSHHDAAYQNTVVNSAVWTVQRLNYLESSHFKLGLEIFQTCTEKDVYNSVFNVYQQNYENFALGLISLRKVPDKIERLCGVLDINCKTKANYWYDLVKSTVTLLEIMNWSQNLTVIVPNEKVLEEFNSLTRAKGMCVGRAIILEKKNIQLKYIFGHNVVFGDKRHIDMFINNIYKHAIHDNPEFIFIPLDGLPAKELPEGSYVIHPSYLEDSQKYNIGSKIVPSPIFFDIASPIVNLVHNITAITSVFCGNTSLKLDCFKNLVSNLHNRRDKITTPFEILSALKIETLLNQFGYNIFRVENISLVLQGNHSKLTSDVQTFVPVGIYNMFDQSLITIEPFSENSTSNKSAVNCSVVPTEECFTSCINFELPLIYDQGILDEGLKLRSEAWVFGFLAISALGCLFCLAILIFFVVRLCKKDVFEGNPTLTILLLLVVICMYSSVVPFALTGEDSIEEILCMIRSLSTSLTYAAAFSLLLSRCIILSTISKEVGFMAHASGPVQVFLGTFMFACQVALSIQLLENCVQVMHLQCFLCILSYNGILLFLLLCTTFFIAKSERNYKEGKYFTIAIFFITCIWSIWAPIYWLYRDWEDEILCFGLVGTASTLLGAVLIPRTYVMTVSVARDKFTSALPALAHATSAIDIYRASTQPIYDCINVAAITANASAIRSNVIHHPYLYTCPSFEDEFVPPKCETPVTSDKLTRF